LHRPVESAAHTGLNGVRASKVRETNRVVQPSHMRKVSDKAAGRAGAQGSSDLAIAGHSPQDFTACGAC